MNKRIFSILFAAFFLFAVFTGCDSNPSENPPDTTPPTISTVGADKTTLQLPDETTITLSGAATSANGSAVKSYQWVVDAPPSLPEGAQITNTSNLSATVTGLNVAGTYKFRLKVTGSNDIEKTSDVVTVTVNADARQPIISSKGASKTTLQLPDETSVQLNCSSTSADGSAVKAIAWSVETAPEGATPNVNNTGAVTNMTVAGEYQFKLVVTGNNDITKTDYVTVNVSADMREPTISSAGANKTTLQLPGETSITLSGAAASADGSAVKSYQWVVDAPPSLPEGAQITNTSNLSATVTGLNAAGTYKFKLVVTGSNDVDKTSNVVAVTVNAAVPSTPDVSAGTDTPNPTLAAGLTVNLTGSADVTNGSVESYEWTVKSAPVGATPVFADSASANTTVSNLKKAGEYVFELTAVNNAEVAGTKEVTVNVQSFQVTKDVNVAAVPFTLGATLKLELDIANNYSMVGGANGYFGANDLAGITYTLSSANPSKTVEELATHIADGKLSMAAYAVNDYPTITQTFYYNGQEIGSRKFVVLLVSSGFIELYEYSPTDFEGELFDTDFEPVGSIPVTTLNLEKEVTELP